jgi:integrase
MKGEELLKFESVKNWFNSLNKSAQKRGKKGISKNGKGIRLGRMWEFTKEGQLNPDELLKEAQENIKLTGKRLDDYFEARKFVTSHNTALTAVSFIRGFFTHNDVSFPRSITLPKKLEAKVATRDNAVSFYDFDEETENLNFRDQTVALCLLSTGADAKDLLNLKMDFVTNDKGELCKKKRFFWHGTRAKTREPFRTFFSEEATEFLKRYVEQERTDADKDEPLFVQARKGRTYTRKNPATGEEETITESVKLDNYTLSKNFRVAAKKMGYTEENKSSPFRPKRFRHIFRTACAIAEIDPGYTRAMMGHASDNNAGYLERDPALFKMVYVKIEPLLTVFGSTNVQELIKIKDTLALVVEGNKGVADKTQRLENKAESLEAKVEELSSQLKRAVKYISQLTEEIENRNKLEAQEDFNKLVAEIDKEHPIPKKVKSE